MDRRTSRQLQFLRAYVAVSSGILGVLVFAAFQGAGQPDARNLRELNVERINIVESDGSPRLVLTNESRAPAVIIDGVRLRSQGGGRPGIIFYNDEGDEAGALIFNSNVDQAGRYRAGGQLSFDQYNQDQVVGLRYIDDGQQRLAGLQVWDRPAIPLPTLADRYAEMRAMADGPAKGDLRERLDALSPTRVFVGRTTAGSAVLRLMDPNGRTRIRIQVDSSGVPLLEFLDESGKAVCTLPGSSSMCAW